MRRRCHIYSAIQLPKSILIRCFFLSFHLLLPLERSVASQSPTTTPTAWSFKWFNKRIAGHTTSLTLSRMLDGDQLQDVLDKLNIWTRNLMLSIHPHVKCYVSVGWFQFSTQKSMQQKHKNSQQTYRFRQFQWWHPILWFQFVFMVSGSSCHQAPDENRASQEVEECRNG